MADATADDFKIEFVQAGEPEKGTEAWYAYSRQDLCIVRYRFERVWQKFEVQTFVDRALMDADEYIKVAKHQLHLDFVRLAEQTKDWKLPDDQVPQKPEQPEMRPFPRR